jgi:ABC-type transport system involved in multi-copper enzyme maturation permease subunit
MRVSFLRQIIAIVRYEMLIQWRRGNLKMILVLIIVAPLLLVVLGTTPDSLMHQALMSSSDAMLPIIATDVAVFTTVALLPLLLFGLPLYVSETIPYDRQYGIRDLLDTLPLGHGVYLTGKIAAVWFGVMIAILISALVSGIISTLAFGAIGVQVWIALWAGGLLVLSLLTSGVSILSASGQANRRRALLVGFLSLPVYFVAYLLSPVSTFTLSSLNRISLVMMSQDVLRVAPAEGFPASWSFLLFSLFVVILFWMVTWGWERWRGSHT